MILEERINALEAELAKVKAELAERNNSIWLPEDGQEYYRLTGSGMVSKHIFTNILSDNLLKLNNNVFKYNQSTFNHLAWYNDNVIKVQNRLMQLHELLCPDYFPDWKNDHEDKYSIYFDNNQRTWKHSLSVIANPQTVIFTYEVAKKVCEILNSEKFMMDDGI